MPRNHAIGDTFGTHGILKASLVLILLFALVLVAGMALVDHQQKVAIANIAELLSKRTVANDSSQTEAKPLPAKRTVKVGISTDGFWFLNGPDHKISGYGETYMEEIAKYTNWKYEYVVLQNHKSATSLKTGRVDILAPVAFSQDKVGQMTFTSYPMGTTRMTFYTLPDTAITYKDFTAFNHKRIGVIKGSTSAMTIDGDARVNGYEFKKVYFKDNASLIAGLRDHQADIIVASSMCMSKNENLRIINEMQDFSFYLAVSNKSTSLGRQLNAAVDSIKLANNDFNSTLADKYLESPDDSRPYFTTEENNYIKHAKTLRIAYVAMNAPLEDTAKRADRSTTGISGISDNVLSLIAQKTGLTFRGVAYNTLEEAEDGVKNNEADMITTYLPSGSAYATDGRIISTSPYLNVPVLAERKRGSSEIESTFAVPYILRWVAPVIKRTNPKTTCTVYPGYEQSIEAANHKIADVALIPSTISSALYSGAGNGKLTTSTYSPFTLHLCFGISDREDENLVRIMNKGVASISEVERNKVVSEVQPEANSVSVLSILERFWIQILLIAAIISSIIMAVLYNSRKRNLREVEYIAYVDPITGLPNRLKFVEEITSITEYEKDGQYALAVLDIDGYKSINDMYGMVFGDELLGFLGARIRESAPERALVARDSGDEFLLFTRYRDEDDLNDIFARIIASISRVSFKHAGVLDLSVSTGVYLLSKEDCTPLSAINRADIARTRIKPDHGKHINFFTEEMRAELANETILENDLKLALERGEFELYYQPKIRLETNCINGFEGLIRWHHPLAGLLGPATFIPLAERIGLISKITEWVIDQCCKDLSQIGGWWALSSSDFEQKNGADIRDFAVRTSINLSPVDLSNPHLINVFNEALTRYGVKPCNLEVEITESALLENANASMTIIKGLQDIGIDIALDDFGTGYSSLGYLKDLPLNTVKLDRIFIHDIETDERSRKALRSMIDLVHTLDYKIVAEGIEDEFQATFLKEAGCETAQGFYFAPAMPLLDSYRYFISALKEFGCDTRIDKG